MIIFYRLVGKSNLFRFSIKGLYSIKGSHTVAVLDAPI